MVTGSSGSRRATRSSARGSPCTRSSNAASAPVRSVRTPTSCTRSGRPWSSTRPEAVVVEVRHLGAGVVERVAELGARPPRVERHDDGAEERGAPEADDELGQVAHRDRDPVAALHAERRAQVLRERLRTRAHVGEGEAFVVVHEVDELCVRDAHVEGVEDGARRPHEHAQRHAVERDLLDLEGAAGPDERRKAGVVAVDGSDHARTLPRDLDVSPQVRSALVGVAGSTPVRAHCTMSATP